MHATGERARCFESRMRRYWPGSYRQPQHAWFGTGRWRTKPNWRKIGVVQGLASSWTRSQAPMTKVELPLVDVIRLRPMDGYRLWLRFTDGSEGVRDLSDLLASDGPMIEPLRDP